MQPLVPARPAIKGFHQPEATPGDDKAGTLRLVRIGKQLEYFIAPKGKPARSIATADFGDRPIETVAFQVLAPAARRLQLQRRVRRHPASRLVT